MEQDLKVVIDGDSSGAQDAIGGFNNSLDSILTVAAGIGLEQLAQQFIELGTTIAQVSVDAAANMQNIGISAQYAFGTVSDQVLGQIDKLSKATPFLNTQLDQMGIKLANLGIPTSQVTSELSDISNIAAATGTDMASWTNVLTQATNSLGIATQTGTINSRQLLPLARAGVPIYQALANELNKTGGAYDLNSKGGMNSAASVAAAAAKQQTLNIQLQNAQEQLTILQQKYGDTTVSTQQYNDTLAKDQSNLANVQNQLKINTQTLGAYTAAGITSGTKFETLNATHERLLANLRSAQNALSLLQEKQSQNGPATDAHNLAITKQQEAIRKLTAEITANNAVVDQNGKKQLVTAADLANNTKSFALSKDIYTKSMHDIATGKDKDAAQKQSETWIVILSKLQDAFKKTGESILGVDDATGKVAKNGLFAQLQKAAQDLMNFLNANKAGIVAFAQQIVKSFESEVAPAIERGFAYFMAHKNEIIKSIENIASEFLRLGAFIINIAIPAFLDLMNFIGKNRQTILLITDAVLLLFFAFSKLLVPIAALTKIGSLFSGGLGASLHIPGFAAGVQNFGGGVALVGEQGAELVNLPKGSSVTPTSQTNRMLTNAPTVNIYNPTVRSNSDISALVAQVQQVLGRQGELVKMGAM